MAEHTLSIECRCRPLGISHSEKKLKKANKLCAFLTSGYIVTTFCSYAVQTAGIGVLCVMPVGNTLS